MNAFLRFLGWGKILFEESADDDDDSLDAEATEDPKEFIEPFLLADESAFSYQWIADRTYKVGRYSASEFYIAHRDSAMGEFCVRLSKSMKIATLNVPKLYDDDDRDEDDDSGLETAHYGATNADLELRSASTVFDSVGISMPVSSTSYDPCPVNRSNGPWFVVPSSFEAIFRCVQRERLSRTAAKDKELVPVILELIQATAMLEHLHVKTEGHFWQSNAVATDASEVLQKIANIRQRLECLSTGLK